jgi:hypothetical protein
LDQQAQEYGLAYFLGERLQVGPCHATGCEHIGSPQSKPSEPWSEDVTTVVLLLHKTEFLECCQQAVHGTLWQVECPSDVSHPSPLWAVFKGI